MADLTIKITTEWRSVQPDGGKCLCCRDGMFLSQRALVAVIEGQKDQTVISVCGSCYDVVKGAILPGETKF